jgi:hypothetical protein
MGMYGGLHEEVEILKRDKGTLYMELVRMRKAQEVSHAPGSQGSALFAIF